MIDDYLNGNKQAKPFFQLFDTVISACTGRRSNCPTSTVTAANAYRAESVLRLMWSLHESGQLGGVPPQCTTYNHVMIGFKNSATLFRLKNICGDGAKTSREVAQETFSDCAHRMA